MLDCFNCFYRFKDSQFWKKQEKTVALNSDLILQITTFLTIPEQATLIATLDKSCYRLVNNPCSLSTTPSKISQAIDKLSKTICTSWPKPHMDNFSLTKYSVTHIKKRSEISQNQMESVFVFGDNIVDLGSNFIVQKVYVAQYIFKETSLDPTTYRRELLYYPPPRRYLNVDVKIEFDKPGSLFPEQDNKLIEQIGRFVQSESDKRLKINIYGCLIL